MVAFSGLGHSVIMICDGIEIQILPNIVAVNAVIASARCTPLSNTGLVISAEANDDSGGAVPGQWRMLPPSDTDEPC